MLNLPDINSSVNGNLIEIDVDDLRSITSNGALCRCSVNVGRLRFRVKLLSLLNSPSAMAGIPLWTGLAIRNRIFDLIITEFHRVR
jgi:hypothetical protein